LATGQEKSPSGREKPGTLTSRPSLSQSPLAALKVGDEIITGAGQQRRLQLADGSILFVNQLSEVKLTEAGRLTLKAGEVYVEGCN
jgi:ferric-dicitrate binding protein FerR (iron transport regulator)